MKANSNILVISPKNIKMQNDRHNEGGSAKGGTRKQQAIEILDFTNGEIDSAQDQMKTFLIKGNNEKLSSSSCSSSSSSDDHDGSSGKSDIDEIDANDLEALNSKSAPKSKESSINSRGSKQSLSKPKKDSKVFEYKAGITDAEKRPPEQSVDTMLISKKKRNKAKNRWGRLFINVSQCHYPVVRTVAKMYRIKCTY